MKSWHGEPSALLKPYVKGYWVHRVERNVSDEVMFPNGHIDLTTNISYGSLVTRIGGHSATLPQIEILGQLTKPSRVTMRKGTVLLMARFYPYASSLFFPAPVSNFTNESTGLYQVLQRESIQLYQQVMNEKSVDQKIAVLDAFLIRRLSNSKRNFETLKLVGRMCDFIYSDITYFSIKDLTHHCGCSERRIQKLFLDWVGVTPIKLFSIRRFSKSLKLVQSLNRPLTDIAHECGYYDQAHFIREFKSYTGLTPSHVAHLAQGFPDADYLIQ